MSGLKTGVYRHYKGNLYQVLSLAMHSETGQKLVVYKALYETPDLEAEYGQQAMFVRPYEMFIETVDLKGKNKPRFEFVGGKA